MQTFSKIFYSFTIIAIFLINSGLSAQDNKQYDEYAQPNPNSNRTVQSNNWTNRIFTGGGLGLQFGTVTLIDVSPQIGYRLTNNVAVGIGGTYQYIKANDLQSNVYGGRIFGRYYFRENIFAHVEYELLSLEPLYDYYSYIIKGQRTYVESYLVGGGYREPIGGRASLNIMILWNLSTDPMSPYVNPIFRFGLNFGL